MSRSDFRSCPTRETSQPRLNGASDSAMPRLARINTASPDHTCDRRVSSTTTAGSLTAASGSLIITTRLSALAAVISPALPSVNSSTTGPAACIRTNWRQFRRTPFAHNPHSCAQAANEAAEATVSPDARRKLTSSSSMP